MRGGAAADSAVEDDRWIGWAGTTISAFFQDGRDAQLWIEGRFRESKGGARRCANKPKPTKGYVEVPLGAGSW